MWIKAKKQIALILVPLCLVFACSKTEDKKTEENATNRPSNVLDYLKLSSQFLINQQQQNGFFNYEYDFITGNYTPWDNIVHQARAGYVLGTYYAFLVRNNLEPSHSIIVRDSVSNALRGYADASLERSDTPGKMLSFYYNKGGSFKTISNNETVRQDFRKSRLDAEIIATGFALMTEIIYWQTTSDMTYSVSREKWRDALVFQANEILNKPTSDKQFYPELWLAFSFYDMLIPNDKEVEEILLKMDKLFTQSPRVMVDAQDYVWDMVAANLRYQKKDNPAFLNFGARQTIALIEKIYTQHDTNENSCALSLGLVEASLLLNKKPSYERIEQTALGRSQLEYYSSLKYMILPDQTWIALGPGRTLHSQDFKRFVGAYTYGRHIPKTSIELSEMCLMTGMRFSKTDLLEIKQ